MSLNEKEKAKVEHKPPIAQEDLKKLYASPAFNVCTPAGLQNKVFFEVRLYFCRRGQENLRELRKDTSGFGVDSTGARYVFQKRDELTKNRRENSEPEEGGLMFERKDDPTCMCPVQSMEMYMSRLNPHCEAFFQRPKKQVCESVSVWYDNQVVGINMLAGKMKALSKQAELSREYTNHSIRATSVTILDHCGFEARHIMCVSGHKSESSIRSYASKTSDEMKLAMSSGLSKALCGNRIRGSPFKRSKNTSVVTNETVAIDSSKSRSKIQFSFYNCTVNIVNK